MFQYLDHRQTCRVFARLGGLALSHTSSRVDDRMKEVNVKQWKLIYLCGSIITAKCLRTLIYSYYIVFITHLTRTVNKYPAHLLFQIPVNCGLSSDGLCFS